MSFQRLCFGYRVAWLESRGVIYMSTIKVRTKRQITIPKTIFNDLGLKEGDYVEIIRSKNQIVIKPKKIHDTDEDLTPEEEKIVEKGIEQLKRGECINWEELKNELGL
ncbi:MAG: antitoxin PrlF [Candidatus Poribacteria bacterium]|nr:antitoxin PrlF [Candidatus Poribacteria bacterium]